MNNMKTSPMTKFMSKKTGVAPSKIYAKMGSKTASKPSTSKKAGKTSKKAC